ncbi:hypothetical protein F5ESL0245_04590 [Lactobacillus sp. ESL0245]|nr:hypothetical protein F5ESL0247_04585 [Lactobacillus sp. ESL0247]RMC28594.1 hypothetical protein F5ESL0246_04585 [Lactobacillus sp. ESL0246]RMC31786.1 hypothetical protein F5ESL0245_04590 [Lactobacillus sp. ESL0245]
MGKLFKNLHRPRTTHQDVTDNLIITSHCWAGINDLSAIAAGIDSRNIKRARRQSDSVTKLKMII